MSIVRETIKPNGLDLDLKFTLSSDDSFLGYQQEIDSLTQVVSTDLINPPIDAETRKFKYVSVNDPTQLEFSFSNNGGSTYGVSFINAGFSESDIDTSSLNVLNSFFILSFYNSYDVYNQVKIFTGYITRITDLTKQQKTPSYTIDVNNKNQWYYWYLPEVYINTELAKLESSGITNGLITGYTSFVFYNGETGNIDLFYNNANVNLSTPLKMYFPTLIDLNNRTWNFIGGYEFLAKQLVNSTAYSNRYNNTVTNTDNVIQNYPSGSEFDETTGKYE